MQFEQSTGGTLKVHKTTLKDGELRFTFAIIRNKRVLGRPTNVRLAKVLTVNESDLKSRAAELYQILDETIAELTKNGTLWVNDREKILRQASKYVARPVKSDYEKYRELVKQVGEAAERKLAERGI